MHCSWNKGRLYSWKVQNGVNECFLIIAHSISVEKKRSLPECDCWGRKAKGLSEEKGSKVF